MQSSSRHDLQRPCLQVGVPTQRYASEEEIYMNWFHIRTVTKIPGLFVDGFWLTLLRQASASEPAVVHATVTLSSVHKTGGDGSILEDKTRVDVQKRFMLRNYSKAISCLQPHFTTKGSASTRIVLIACIVFTCLELLRGHFKTAQGHLKNGLQVLQEHYGCICEGVFILRPKDAADQSIVEVFQRLHVQVVLFHATHEHSNLILQLPIPQISPTDFRTHKDAWTEHERCLYMIIDLKGKVHLKRLDCTGSSISEPCKGGLLPLQQHLQSSLALWRTTYEPSRHHLDHQEPTLFINAMLMNYYTLAAILCSTALSTELAYDGHTPQFLEILSNSIYLWKARAPPDASKTSRRIRFDMSHSTVTFGWAPPLYYTAIKCRVRSVRLHAVRLLESTIHREGIWDCRIASRIMRKAMDIEDEGIYHGAASQGPLDILPGVDREARPAVPLRNRLAEIEVELQDEIADEAVMGYRKACDGAQWERVQVSLGQY